MAKEGVNCRVCKVWISKGKRRPNQILCCNDDSKNLTDCQRKYYKDKRDAIARLRKPIDYGYIFCDMCNNRIKKVDATQKRCMSEETGKTSECQKKAMRQFASRQYWEPKQKPELKPKAKPASCEPVKKRLCMKCQEKFPSEHKFHRICDKCSALNEREARMPHKIETIGFPSNTYGFGANQGLVDFG